MDDVDTLAVSASGDQSPGEAPAVTITPACAARVRTLIEGEADPPPLLRVMVDGGGCSGFQYRFDLDRVVADEDRVFADHGIRVVIDETSLELLAGAIIDYTEDLMAAGFTIRNPNATATCGCGTSFSV
ncbi:iron-sulfur cluster insertion protein ErpA [Roseospira visakhapatnamensis]|uniref:Iron-sulfur cluster insertion protein n=1 Tax=Roseospira visakhapatnamensis TaxID=390880 RepID=A0A7W6W9D2_9PROT|nr:iron-sulfur cluster insertion protein ErpA [Roseospira visakhapatnamensis]MBB4265698.1 iron-sulfur cluster insertion protein [Roseospira visakhapatnamensis]